MARRRQRQREEREGRFDMIVDFIALLIELLAYAPRLIFGLFRFILHLFN